MEKDNIKAQHSFDAYCKKIIINQAKDIWRSEKRIRKKFKLFSGMSAQELEQALSESPEEFSTFIVSGFKVLVHDFLLVEAIRQLDGKKKTIILLYYFVGYKDAEIARLFKISRSAVQKHRAEAIKDLAEHLGESDESKGNVDVGND